jgi:hypothetical protein
LFGKKQTKWYKDSMIFLLNGKILTVALFKKVARSDLRLCHLAVSSGELDGVYCILTEKVNGKQRVTAAVKRIYV